MENILNAYKIIFQFGILNPGIEYFTKFQEKNPKLLNKDFTHLQWRIFTQIKGKMKSEYCKGTLCSRTNNVNHIVSKTFSHSITDFQG